MDWPPGWRDLTPEEAENLRAQLAREARSGHILFERQFSVIARRDDQEDVLVALDDGEIAELNLAWTRNIDANFLGALLYMDLSAWREAQF